VLFWLQLLQTIPKNKYCYVFNVIKVQWVTMVTISGLCSHTQKPRKVRLCAGCDEKETGCTRASLADTLYLHQVDNG